MISFMSVLLIFSYLNFFRAPVTLGHFKYGKQVYTWIRRKGPCFRRFDRRDTQTA